MVGWSTKGEWTKTEKFLMHIPVIGWRMILDKYGKRGVEALKAATPIDSGKTAASWSYEIEKTGNGYSIHWNNSNTNKGAKIAILLQYGHGTGTGGYVQGVDYINPALNSIFTEMANEAWKEVNNNG